MNIILYMFWESVTSGIVGSLIAGFLTIAIIEGFKYYNNYLHMKKFKKVFGIYETELLNLVVPALEVRTDVKTLLRNSNLQGNQFPLMKYGGALIRSSKLLGYADIVSLKYVLNIIASTLGSKSVVMTDADLQSQLDISFVSFGGSCFYCTYVLNQMDNRFYTINGNSIARKHDPNVCFQIDQTYDYGFIIKYQHSCFPTRTWIVIAGLGESGTRGAGWFLSNHWKQFSDLFNDGPFGIVVRVDHGIDQSAVEVDRIY